MSTDRLNNTLFWVNIWVNSAMPSAGQSKKPNLQDNIQMRHFNPDNKFVEKNKLTLLFFLKITEERNIPFGSSEAEHLGL